MLRKLQRKQQSMLLRRQRRLGGREASVTTGMKGPQCLVTTTTLLRVSVPLAAVASAAAATQALQRALAPAKDRLLQGVCHQPPVWLIRRPPPLPSPLAAAQAAAAQAAEMQKGVAVAWRNRCWVVGVQVASDKILCTAQTAQRTCPMRLHNFLWTKGHWHRTATATVTMAVMMYPHPLLCMGPSLHMRVVRQPTRRQQKAKPLRQPRMLLLQTLPRPAHQCLLEWEWTTLQAQVQWTPTMVGVGVLPMSLLAGSHLTLPTW